MKDQTDQQATYPIDVTVLRDMLGDDEKTIRYILGDFVAPTTSLLGSIKKSIADRDGDGMMQSAHNLKSAARSVGALALGDLCQTLELAGKERNWSDIDAAAAQLDKLAKDVFEYIRKM